MGKYSDVEPLVIEEVRKFPALWGNQNYKNTVVKEKSWREVAETFNRYTDFFDNIGPTRERR